MFVNLVRTCTLKLKICATMTSEFTNKSSQDLPTGPQIKIFDSSLGLNNLKSHSPSNCISKTCTSIFLHNLTKDHCAPPRAMVFTELRELVVLVRPNDNKV